MVDLAVGGFRFHLNLKISLTEDHLLVLLVGVEMLLGVLIVMGTEDLGVIIQRFSKNKRIWPLRSS